MTKSSCAVYLGLGSNLERPLQQIQTALLALQQQPEITVVKTSSLYRTAPVGHTAQPDFINAVVEISTTLTPQQLLTTLLALEQAQGRIRIERWGPRVIDLDILLFGQYQINEPALTIPHPHLTERAFVLYPLAEIAPTLQLPDGRHLNELLAQCPAQGIEKISPV